VQIQFAIWSALNFCFSKNETDITYNSHKAIQIEINMINGSPESAWLYIHNIQYMYKLCEYTQVQNWTTRMRVGVLNRPKTGSISECVCVTTKELAGVENVCPSLNDGMTVSNGGTAVF
jgi:hypothetical protein